MADPTPIPELQPTRPDGTPRSRIEMDQWIREVLPKVHWLRIIAVKVLGLPKAISWDMKEVVLRHWLLDELVRRGQIHGEQLGVNAQQSNDEGELRQFTQRLAHLIQTGQAVQPHAAEGVDMNGFTPPPPPVGGAPAPNGQTQQAYPPGPPAPPMAAPPGPPGYAQPPMPQPPGPPQQGFAPPPPPGGGYAAAPQPPQPMGPPGGYAQPPGPPAGAPPMGPPMGAPPGPPAPPQAAAPAGGRGRRKAEPAGAPQQAAPPAPPAPPGAGFAPPPGFGPAPGAPSGGFAPLPAAPQQFAPPQAQPQYEQPQVQQVAPVQAAPAVDLTPLTQRIDQLQQQVASLTKLVEYTSMVATAAARVMYQKQGTFDAAGFLKELGVALPQ